MQLLAGAAWVAVERASAAAAAAAGGAAGARRRRRQVRWMSWHTDAAPEVGL